MKTSRWFFSRCFFAGLLLNIAAAPAFAHEGDTVVPGPVASPPPAPLTPMGPADARETVWPFVVVGLGAVTLGTGVWLVHRDDNNPAMPACTTMQGGHTTCPYSTATQWQGWGFVAIGAQMMLAGIAWRLYEVRRATGHISLAAVPGGLRLGGTF